MTQKLYESWAQRSSSRPNRGELNRRIEVQTDGSDELLIRADQKRREQRPSVRPHEAWDDYVIAIEYQIDGWFKADFLDSRVNLKAAEAVESFWHACGIFHQVGL